MENKSSKSTVIITLIVIIVLAIGAYFIFRPQSPVKPAVTIDTTNQPTMGNPQAAISIVSFEDLKCENCRRFNITLFPQIKQKYIDTGKAKYTLINVAFIPGSLPAANAAHCLYIQNKNYFFPFVEYLFENQPPENQDWATVPTLIQFAKVSVPKANLIDLSNCIIEARYANFINNNLKMAANVMGGEVATPALYINGHKLETFTLDAVDQMINTLSKK
ncbi:MAG: dihydromonapterin reductase [Coxiella sp. RIFCSPHIGHO2_12_FULL_42_15]|nr:MAG: dihydromonapterin reductase [Coxiella sp. RIFCSPHIGHO2_12_FULL_42_15]